MTINTSARTVHFRRRAPVGSTAAISAKKLETVSRAFSKFQQGGLIGVRQKCIRILDSAGLERVMARDPD
jgi:CRP/FNR family transcriptional regulator